MNKSKKRNTNTMIVAIFIASGLTLLSHLAISFSLDAYPAAFATAQTQSHNDNHNSDKSSSNINNRPGGNQENNIVCAASITTCPPPTGGITGAII
ncbi:MAG: hypothetical protein ACTHJ7_08850 [Candidatus Nitrosocosmicus sp.]